MRTRDRFPVCAGVDISSGEKINFFIPFFFPIRSSVGVESKPTMRFLLQG